MFISVLLLKQTGIKVSGWRVLPNWTSRSETCGWWVVDVGMEQHLLEQLTSEFSLSDVGGKYVRSTGSQVTVTGIVPVRIHIVLFSWAFTWCVCVG